MRWWRNIWADEATGRLRAGWRAALFLLLATFLWAIVLFAIVNPIFTYAVKAEPSPYLDQLIVACALIPACIGAGVVALSAFEHLPAYTLGLTVHGGLRWMQAVGIGLVLGVGLVGILVFVLLTTNTISLVLGDIGVSGGRAILVVSGGLLVMAMADEVLVHGYLFQTLLRGLGPVPALCCTALCYVGWSLLWHGAPRPSLLDITDIFLAGMLYGLLYLRVGTLWLPIGLHAGWSIGGLLFNLPTHPLGAVPPSPFLATFVPASPWAELLGPRGETITALLLLAVIAVLTYSRRGLSLVSHWWEWRHLSLPAKAAVPWDFTIGSRSYQWKLLIRDPLE